MNFLAMSCVCPAIVPLVGNLIISDDSAPAEEDPEWLKNYITGKGYEVYRTVLSDSFIGMPFLEIAKILYEETAAVRVPWSRQCVRHA